ncbi:MAG: radical SAM protein [Ruminococcaceae bacterium]|nr:radical SAM protein [Oscillospiraceae bacterium]
MTVSPCYQCPRQCGAVRTDDNNHGGFCRMPALPVVARAALHYGEEPCISGTNGSGTIFFSGCSLHCLFCQNESISHKGFGKTISIERLADIFRELENDGAHNINLVNPTHFAAQIRKAIELYKPSVPILYNSSGYERPETIHMLDGLVDVYLPDCKYIHSEIAERFSGASDYFEYAQMAIPMMAKQTGPVQLDEHGLIRKGTIVRHLVLPGHTRESIAVLDWLSQYKDMLWISLMFQYTPMGNVTGLKELQRSLTRRECDKVWSHVVSLGINDGYIQSLDSTGKDMIPAFDLTGV